MIREVTLELQAVSKTTLAVEPLSLEEAGSPVLTVGVLETLLVLGADLSLAAEVILFSFRVSWICRLCD